MQFSGAKGGGGGSFKQRADTLRSNDTFEGVLVLCNGPILGPSDGLKSQKIDGTPIEDASGAANFKDVVMITADGDPLKFPQIATLKLGTGAAPVSVNLPVGNTVGGGSPGPWVTKTLPNTAADAVDLRFIVSQLYRQDKKGIYEATANLEIQMKPTGATTWINPNISVPASTYSGGGMSFIGRDGSDLRAYIPEEYFDASGNWLPETNSGYIAINGKTTSAYVHELRIEVPNSGAYTNVGWDIRVRLREVDTLDADPNFEKRIIQWESLAAVYNQDLGDHPDWRGVAWAHIFGKASDQFSGAPEIEGVYKTKIVSVPPIAVYNPATRQYTGTTWDGSFSKAYTNDPAWVINDALADGLFGMSAITPGAYLNKWDALEVSKYCSQLVSDGGAGTHPRFSLNLKVTEAQKADEFIRYLAGAISGHAWDNGNGEWRIKLDKPEQPVDVLTLESIEGEFSYSHTDLNSRFNDITMTFLNAEMDFREDRVRVVDNDHIALYGRKPTTMVAVGCTHRQEALRRAVLRLRASTNEWRMVTFMTNRRARLYQPFETILIADGDLGYELPDPLSTPDPVDPTPGNNRTTGRILSLNGARTEITLRDSVRLEIGVVYLAHFTVPNPDYNPDTATQPTSPNWTKPTITITRTLTNTAGQRGDVNVLYLDSALPSNIASNANFALEAAGLPTIPRTYRILELRPEEDGERVAVTAIEVDTGKYAAADSVVEADLVYVAPPVVVPPPLPPVAGEVLSLVEIPGDGLERINLVVNWQRPSSVFLKGFSVRYRVNNGPFIDAVSNLQDTTWELVDPPAGLYHFEVVAHDRRGSSSLPLVDEIEVSAAAIAALGAIQNPNVLSISEKVDTVLPREEARTGTNGRYPTARARAVALSLSVTAVDDANSGWLTYRNSITGWNDTTVHSAIDRATWDSLSNAFDAQLNLLDQAISAEDAKRAVVGGGLVDTAGNPISSDNVRNNLALIDWWRAGNVIPWSGNGGAGNELVTMPHPSWPTLKGPMAGIEDVMMVRAGLGGTGDAAGGWNSAPMAPLNPDKTYRFVLPILQPVDNTYASAYWGTGLVADINTTLLNANPYFAVSGGLPRGVWCLFVGYIFPRNSTGKSNDSAGIWNCSTGQKIAGGSNYCFLPDGTQPIHRSYQYYADPSVYQFMGKPLIECVDGSETDLRQYFGDGATLNNAIQIDADGNFINPVGTGTGTNVSNTTVALRFTGATSSYAVYGNGLKNVSGSWEQYVYTEDSYVNGASVSATLVGGYSVLGLSTKTVLSGPPENGAVDYGIYRYPDSGTYNVVSPGTSWLDTGVAIGANDRVSIRYDNQKVRFYVNGTQIFVVNAIPNQRLYGTFVAGYSSGEFKNIEFSSYSDNVSAAGLAAKKLTSIGALPAVIEGNSIRRPSGNSDYEVTVRGEPVAGACFVEAILAPGGYTMISLDTEATGLDYAVQSMTVHALNASTDYGYSNGVNVLGVPSGVAGQKIRLVYDGTRYQYYIDGVQKGPDIPAPAGLTHYPKVTAYNNAYPITGIDYGPYSQVSAETKFVVQTDSGPTLRLVGANTIKRDSNGGWNSQCYSEQGYEGGAFCSFSPSAANSYFMAGLNSDPLAGSSYTSLDYCFHVEGDGNIKIWESNININKPLSDNVFGTWSAGIVLSVTYDNEHVRYLINGEEVRCVRTTPGRKFYFDSSIVGGSPITNIRFGPLTPDAASVDFIHDGDHQSQRGNSVYKNSRAVSAWNSKSVSRQVQTGTAFVSGKLSTYATFIGLKDSGDGGASYPAMRASFHRSGDGNWYTYSYSGQRVALGTTYNGVTFNENTEFRITYDGVMLRWYADNTLMDSTADTSGRTYAACVVIGDVGCRVDNIQFGPYTDNAWSSVGGANRPADNATNDTFQDTRNDNQPPTWYWTQYPYRTAHEFKDGYYLGIPGVPAVGYYGSLISRVDYADPSGGPIKQEFTVGTAYSPTGLVTGQKFIRYSTSTTTWGSWFKDFSALQPPRLGTSGELLTQTGDPVGDGDVLNHQLEGGVLRVASPIGGGYGYASPITGVIKIMLPAGISNAMVKFTVDVFEYNGEASQKYEVSGYTYSDGPYWVNCTGHCTARLSATRTIRWGREGGRWVVLIGDVAGNWSYPSVRVRDVQVSYSSMSPSLWKSGWSVSIETASYASIDSSVAVPTAGDVVVGVNTRRTGGGLLGTSELLNENQLWAQVGGAGRPEDYSTKGSNKIYNGDASQGLNGWSKTYYQLGTFELSAESESIGGQRSFALRKAASGSGQAVAVCKSMAVIPGQKLFGRMSYYGSHNTANGVYFRIAEYNARPEPTYLDSLDMGGAVSGSVAASSFTDLISNGPCALGLTKMEASYTVPAGIYWVSIMVLNWELGPATLIFDDVYLGESELGADITSYITGPAKIVIDCDNNGTPLTGQLTKTTPYKLMKNGVDETNNATWSSSVVLAGTITQSTANTGVNSITAISTLTARFRISATLGSAVRWFDVDVEKRLAPAETGASASGGTSATVPVSFASMSNVMSTASNELIFNTGSAGTATMTGIVSFGTDGAAPHGSWSAYWIWQRWNGSAWVDVDTEVLSTQPTIVSREWDGTDWFYYETQVGQLDVGKVVTGLTANAQVKFRLCIRCFSTARTLYFYTGSNIGGTGS